MEKLQMCRICLVEGVCMYVVVNKNLHQLYEKLTDIPFVTEDSRPMLACYFCCAKLKQCWRFQRKCLEAEELFSQMMNEDGSGRMERDPLKNSGHLEFFNGFVISPVVNMSTQDGGNSESDAIKEELPDLSEGLIDIIEPEDELQTEDLELVKEENNFTDIGDTLTLRDESDSGVTSMGIKTEVRDESESLGAPVAELPKLDTPITKPKNIISVKQMKNKIKFKLKYVSNIGMNKNLNQKSKRMTTFEEPIAKTQHGVTSRVNNTALGTSNRSSEDDINHKISNISVDSEDRNIQKEKRFECHICQRSFCTKQNLTIHKRTHTGEKPYKCDICQRSFRHSNTLLIHTRMHTGERPYKCDICQCSFDIKSKLMRHKPRHGEKLFKCDICTSRFFDKISLKNHIRCHTAKKAFKCDICQRSYRVRASLTYHMRTHTGEKPFYCDICQRYFRCKQTLTRHYRIHTREKPFKCDVCPSGFNVKSRLISHKLKHTGEKPFKCDVCQKSFNRKCNLISHMHFHTGTQPFKCDICHDTFVYKNSFKKHVFLHTGEKPFKCDICQRSFSVRYNLISHKRSHSEKPFKCDICQHRFRKKSSLTNHICKHTA